MILCNTGVPIVTRWRASRIAGGPRHGSIGPSQKVVETVFSFLPRVLRAEAPKRGAAPLSEEECWAIVSFMLIAHGCNVPAGEISAANARDVLIRTP